MNMAWVGGVLSVKGGLNITQNERGYKYLDWRVTNKDRDVLENITAVLGGRIVGPRRHGNTRLYYVRYRGREVSRVFGLVRDHLNPATREHFEKTIKSYEELRASKRKRKLNG